MGNLPTSTSTWAMPIRLISHQSNMDRWKAQEKSWKNLWRTDIGKSGWKQKYGSSGSCVLFGGETPTTGDLSPDPWHFALFASSMAPEHLQRLSTASGHPSVSHAIGPKRQMPGAWGLSPQEGCKRTGTSLRTRPKAFEAEAKKYARTG